MAIADECEPGEEREKLDLSGAASTLLDECRMVLPGIQALFGFQLIAVFNQRFGEELDAHERYAHLGAMCLVAFAVALVMTPAAVHRYYGGRDVTDTFIYLSTLLLLASMVPLAMGLSIDFYLISRLITDAQAVAAILSAALFTVFMFFWVVFPRWRSLHALIGRRYRARGRN
jgi:hypothetical protein